LFVVYFVRPAAKIGGFRIQHNSWGGRERKSVVLLIYINSTKRLKDKNNLTAETQKLRTSKTTP
jgi:hypothetical protein